MKINNKTTKTLRYILGALFAFATLNAFGGGYYGLAGAEGVPLEWLEGSPFDSYFIPSLFLMIVLGGSFLTASIANFASWKRARVISMLTALLAFIWIAVQVSIIGYISWMQPATVTFGVIVLAIAWVMPEKTN